MATTTGQSLNMGPYEKNVGGALSFWGCQVILQQPSSWILKWVTSFESAMHLAH